MLHNENCGKSGGDTVAAIQRMVTSQSHIVPSHDPLVLQRYPAQPGGPADIIRLDAEPLK
jgi:hypothetical protein